MALTLDKAQQTTKKKQKTTAKHQSTQPPRKNGLKPWQTTASSKSRPVQTKKLEQKAWAGFKEAEITPDAPEFLNLKNLSDLKTQTLKQLQAQLESAREHPVLESRLRRLQFYPRVKIPIPAIFTRKP